jgi:prephenate dehydrogenase
MFRQLGLIGCGLMGGSFALAVRQAGLVDRVVGYSPTARSRDAALALGAIDTGFDTPAAAVHGSDLILLALPVASTEATLRAICDALAPETLVMDVGSTKSDVVQAAAAALGDAQLPWFVPAHPIAGKAQAGVAHAQADLYQNCLVVLTPSAVTNPLALSKARQLWQALQCRVRDMTPAAHDAGFAAVSHLPHLLAFALMNAITDQPDGADLLSLAGPGFRDFSRIAAGDPALWRDVLLANRAQVQRQSALFRKQLDTLERCLEHGDSAQLSALISQASGARTAWKMGG